MGLSPVVEAVREVAQAAAPAPTEQLELLPPTRFEPGTPAHSELAERIARDRRGRPPGAQNLATREVVSFVRRVFGDPFVERARYLAHTPATLAAELDCSKLEAFDRIERIRADLCTFMYPRLAPVGTDGMAVPPTFTMVFGGAVGPSSAPGRPPWRFRDTEENQGVIENAPAMSHAEMSHEAAK